MPSTSGSGEPRVDTRLTPGRSRQVALAIRARRFGLRLTLLCLFALLSLAGSILSVCTLGRSVYRWHGFAIELRLLPSAQGQTRVVLIPLGEVRARTHLAPVALVATLQEIRIEEVQKLLNSRTRSEDLADNFLKAARADLRQFVFRQLGMAALGALLAPLLIHSKRFRVYIGSSLIGTLCVAAVLGNALTTFNPNAFNSPTYTGALKQAPWVIRFSRDAFTKMEALSTKLRTVASNLNVLYGRIERLPSTLEGGSDTFRILHVSDIHDNVTAMPFIRQVADEFKVQMIVDTGDLTDFGSPPETAIVHDIARMPYPYIFVLGNHDSQAVKTALTQAKNVTLLQGQLVTIQGLTLLGLPNPASARISIGNVNTTGPGSVSTTQEELDAGRAELLRDVTALPAPPDVIAIHDPSEAQPLWGRVPLILCGHMHRYYVETKTLPPPANDNGQRPASGASGSTALTSGLPTVHATYNTVVCNAGTTGAAGMRYFDREQGVPFSCAVLTFRRATATANAPSLPAGASPTSPPATTARPQLLSIDMIVLNGSLDEYSITHYPIQSAGDGTSPAPANKTGTPPTPSP
jgi:predicted MPP superfamily phosphohydrolase